MALALFFISGACALVYEVVWVRQLLLVMGTTTGAASVVLAVFMLGLGLGAWCFGPLADKSRSPLKLYAYLEAGVGLYGLMLPRLMLLSTAPYVTLARTAAGHPAALIVLRALTVCVLLLVPTLLMGGTLPVLTRHVARNFQALGRDLAFLYSVNLWGGVCGTVLCGFVLIRQFGVYGASLVAVLGNLSIAAFALVVAISGRVPPPNVGAEAEAGADRRPTVARGWQWAAVFFSGFVALGYQILWTRILIFGFTSTVYAFTIILATVLAGLALGSSLLAIVEKRWEGARVLSAALVMAGVSAPPLAAASTQSMALIGALSQRFGFTGDVFLAGMVASTALFILIPATFMGVVLPLGMRLLVRDLARSGQGVGAAYLVNTVGCVIGSLGVGFVLMPLLGLKWAIFTLAFSQVILGLLILVRVEVGRARWLALGASTLAFVVLAGSLLRLREANPFDTMKEAGEAVRTVLAHHDATAGSVTVVDRAGEGRYLRIDGFVAAGAGRPEMSYMAMMTHIPMLLHPDPHRVLVVCFGTGTTAGTGLLYPDALVDVVDINPTVFRFAPYFDLANHGVAHDGRARLIVDDGRNYLLTTQERYDVITSEPMPPKFAGVVNLYSKEYYEIARQRLRPGGILTQWLPVHLLTFEESLAILSTVRSVFPDTTLWFHSGTGIIVAKRDGPVRIDLDRVRRAFSVKAVKDDLARYGVGDPLQLAYLYMAGPDEIRRTTIRVPVITDDHPTLEFHQPTHRIARGLRTSTTGDFFTFERARATEWIWRMQTVSAAPLTGATPAELMSVAAGRAARSREALGELETLSCPR